MLSFKPWVSNVQTGQITGGFTVGLSTGRSGSVLASTRTRPAQIGWNKNAPATDRRPPRVGSAKLRGVNGRVGQV